MCCLFMEFQGLIDCILVLKSTLLSVAENGDKLGVETFSIAIVTAALTDGSEMSLMSNIQIKLYRATRIQVLHVRWIPQV